MQEIAENLARERDALQRVVASMKEIRMLSKTIDNADSLDDYLLSCDQRQQINDRMPEEMAAFGKASCRQLCHATLLALPVELRFEIYEHMCRDERYHVEHSCAQVGIGPAFKPIHYLDPDYVGHAFLKEFVGRFYRTAQFDFSDNHSFIGPWLKQPDRWGVIPKPLVTSVNVDICKDSSTPTFEDDQKSAIQQDLRGLFVLKHDASIVFTLKIQYNVSDTHWRAWNRTFRQVIIVILPTIIRLKDLGYNIKLVADPIYNALPCCGKDCTFTGSTWHDDAVYVFTVENCRLVPSIREALHKYQHDDDAFRMEHRQQLTAKLARGQCTH